MNTHTFGTRPVILEGRRVHCRMILAGQPAPADAVTLPIVLLHGLGCSWEAWEPAMRCLRERGLGQPVYVPDLPGYGRSPGPTEALGIDALADWVVRLMDALGVARAHLAGNSMGCQVALALARRHPARAGGLVLVGPTTGERRVPYWRYALGLFLDGFRETRRYNLILMKMYAQMGLRRFCETVQKMSEDTPMAHADEVMSPVLVLRGERDKIVPQDVAKQLAEQLPCGRFVPVMDAAHALQFYKCTDFVNLALPFWQEAEEGRIAIRPCGEARPM